MLRGRVLHITCARNLPSILAAGAVLGNADGRFPSSFGSSANGFFRVCNAVSVFDYRSVSDEEFKDAWLKCGPHRAFTQYGYKIALLFLAPHSHDRLISWRRWHEQQAWEQMLVPYVEAGFPAPLPIDVVEEIVEVRTRYRPGPLERALLAAQDRNASSEE